MFGRHARLLRRAQDAWDAGCYGGAVGLLEPLLPELHPSCSATDALVVATLATYWSDLGDPRRGLKLLERLPLDAPPATDVHMIGLASRACCRAAAGDLEGAARDRDVLRARDPGHPALVLANAALEGHRSA
jgi:hypothetical protein